MYEVERSALVMHSAEQMFNLVNDVDHYEEFLPWCGGSRIIERGNDFMVASVDIAFRGISKSFTTHNLLQPLKRIDIALVDGPFSELSGCWEFKEISSEASRITLKLKFGFSNRLVGMVVGPVFKFIADSMVDSFCERADQLYQDQN